MATERERLTGKVYFRVEPSKKQRWQAACERLKVREISDFYRDAIDAFADAVLGDDVPQAKPDPKPGKKGR